MRGFESASSSFKLDSEMSITPVRGLNPRGRRSQNLHGKSITPVRGFESLAQNFSQMEKQSITPARGFESRDHGMKLVIVRGITPARGFESVYDPDTDVEIERYYPRKGV